MDVSGLPRNSGRGRIGELATLPVFFDLKGKAVLVAGESDGAAWKAELLASCGAEVHLFARLDRASDAIKAFAARADVVHHDCGWEEAYFKHFALAVGDCEPGEGRAFHGRAREAGVPVNVIDQPDFCQFKFGSIVNRSPLVIGISTDGAAPILAQTVRRKIEALLPHGLKKWAELAQAMRCRVNNLLDTASNRRVFWEKFADLAFADLAFADKADLLEAERLLHVAERCQTQRPVGRISIVGAGPGDAELMTLKAIRALQAADVILFDEAVAAETLELARREARRVAVDGWQGANNILGFVRDLIGDGKHVVRLVSGDPLSSADMRAEVVGLRQLGVRVDIVPGVQLDKDVEQRLDGRLSANGCAGSVHLFAGHYHRASAPLPSAPAKG